MYEFSVLGEDVREYLILDSICHFHALSERTSHSRSLEILTQLFLNGTALVNLSYPILSYNESYQKKRPRTYRTKFLSYRSKTLQKIEPPNPM